MIMDGKSILVTGGTGSLGKTLVRRLLSGEARLAAAARGALARRSQAERHAHRLPGAAGHHRRGHLLQLQAVPHIPDRRRAELRRRLRRHAGPDIVINAAALKQVPTCEYFPDQAVQTNCRGRRQHRSRSPEHAFPVETVVGVSTDKACKPVNVMGMTKAIQERIFTSANVDVPRTRLICVRYGNVLASRGSVIPLFHDQIANGGPVTLTVPEMTRFLLSLDQAVDTIFAAIRSPSRRDLHPGCPVGNRRELARR